MTKEKLKRCLHTMTPKALAALDHVTEGLANGGKPNKSEAVRMSVIEKAKKMGWGKSKTKGE